MATLRQLLIAAAGLTIPLVCHAMNDWAGKTVAMLSSTYDGADCIYFTLDGVTEADPIKSADPTFAIPRSQYGSNDAYAMLLSAKVTGQLVRVITRGTLACGYASVAEVMMR